MPSQSPAPLLRLAEGLQIEVIPAPHSTIEGAVYLKGITQLPVALRSPQP